MSILVRGVPLGAGRPKIIVPIVAQTAEQAATQAAALRSDPAAELAELRADALACLREPAALQSAVRAVRQALGPGKPLLATIRTKREGGQADLSPGEYASLAAALCLPGEVDLVDVELSAGELHTAAVQAAAKAAGLATVFSCHHFEGTPPLEEMTAALCAMGAAGADVCKLAVMPHTPADAAALLQATAQAAAAMPGKPLITMSMGKIGAVTRLCGGAFGSAATFGAAGVSSAPGQPDAASLLRALEASSLCL